jgi:exopolysaccharide production protein ExoZ
LGKVQSLEMLRAAAALLVVLYHTQSIFDSRAGHIPFGGMFGAGYRGVDLFFVLSGFIIAYAHGDDVGRPSRLPNYVFNRVARIYPAAWIMTGLAIGFYSLGFGGSDKAAKLAPTAIIASAALLPQHGDALVTVTWTLKYEMFFYATFAVLIVNRSAGLVLLFLWQVATVMVTLCGVHLGLGGYYFRSICLEFSVGLACAWWLRRLDSVIHPLRWFVLLTGGIVSFVAGMALDHGFRWAGVLCALGAGAIVTSLVRLEQENKVHVPSLLVSIGEASYAIYLVHFSAIMVFAAFLERERAPITETLCLAVAAAGVFAGLGFDRIGDRPIQHWLQRRKPELLCPRLARSGAA